MQSTYKYSWPTQFGSSFTNPCLIIHNFPLSRQPDFFEYLWSPASIMGVKPLRQSALIQGLESLATGPSPKLLNNGMCAVELMEFCHIVDNFPQIRIKPVLVRCLFRHAWAF